MSQKDLKKSAVTGWILAMHCSLWVKSAIFVLFPVLPGIAEAQVIWGVGIVSFNCLLIGNISAKI